MTEMVIEDSENSVNSSLESKSSDGDEYSLEESYDEEIAMRHGEPEKDTVRFEKDRRR